MSFEQFPYRDRNPASGGLDLMPDLPIILRHQSHSLASNLGGEDSHVDRSSLCESGVGETEGPDSESQATVSSRVAADPTETAILYRGHFTPFHETNACQGSSGCRCLVNA
jgi:hypothetical protein